MSTTPGQPQDIVKSPPRVTIGVPTHNGYATISKTIESIESQTFRNFKVVISENASTDQTKEYIKSISKRFETIKIIHHERLISAEDNFKKLLEDCDTDYFVWLSDDDWWEPNFLMECINRFGDDHSIKTVFSNFRVYYHFLDMYSPVIGYVSSGSYDPRLNIYTRISNMAPCAFYGVHRTYAIKAAMARLPDVFDFHDVAITAEMATTGRLLILDQDLYRSGVSTEARMQRRSLDGGALRYSKFARYLVDVACRTFGWKSALPLIPELFFQVHKLKRHNDRVHGQAVKLDRASLLSRSEVDAEFIR